MCKKSLFLRYFGEKELINLGLSVFWGGVGALKKGGVVYFGFFPGNSSFLKNWFPTSRNQQRRERFETLLQEKVSTILFLHCFIHGVFLPRV